MAERSQSATFVVGNIKKNPKQSTRLGLPLSCCLDQASEQGDRNCRGLVAALPAYWALAARTAPSASFSCAIGSPNSAISRSPSFLTTLSPIPVRPDLGRFPRPTAQRYGTGCVNSGCCPVCPAWVSKAPPWPSAVATKLPAM